MSAQRTRSALPLGGFRSPRGWIVIVTDSERTHGPKLTVGDLDRGAIYSADDFDYTPQGADRATVHGRIVAVNALRELALTVMLSGFVIDEHAESELVYAPRRFARDVRPERSLGGVISERLQSTRSYGAHTSWLWFDGTTPRATGSLDSTTVSRAGSALIENMLSALESQALQNDRVPELPSWLDVRVARVGDAAAAERDAIRADLVSRVRARLLREESERTELTRNRASNGAAR